MAKIKTHKKDKSKNKIPFEKTVKSSLPTTENKMTPKNRLKSVEKLKNQGKSLISTPVVSEKVTPASINLKRKIDNDPNNASKANDNKQPKLNLGFSMKLSANAGKVKSGKQKVVDEAQVDQSVGSLLKITKVPEEFITKAVNAVFELNKQHASKTTELLDVEKPVLLQVTSVKVPKCPERTVRLPLPHPLVSEVGDICLFVRDLKLGKRVDHEPTIHHFTDLLKSHGVTRPINIVPMRMVKTEYDQFELKRRLLSQYDHFLTDSTISGHLFHLLGKPFVKKRKLPTCVRLNEPNLKNEIEKALNKTSVRLSSRGNSTVIQVGHTKMPMKSITTNVAAVIEWLAKEYPGGWDNVRSLLLKTELSAPVPVYLTLKSRNEVNIPVVLSKRPKMFRTVEGELTTIPGATATVTPEGKVMIRQEELSDASDTEEKPIVTKPKKTKKKTAMGKEDISNGNSQVKPAEETQDNTDDEVSASDDEIAGDTAEQSQLDRIKLNLLKLRKEVPEKKNDKTTEEKTNLPKKKGKKNKKNANEQRVTKPVQEQKNKQQNNNKIEVVKDAKNVLNDSTGKAVKTEAANTSNVAKMSKNERKKLKRKQMQIAKIDLNIPANIQPKLSQSPVSNNKQSTPELLNANKGKDVTGKCKKKEIVTKQLGQTIGGFKFNKQKDVKGKSNKKQMLPEQLVQNIGLEYKKQKVGKAKVIVDKKQSNQGNKNKGKGMDKNSREINAVQKKVKPLKRLGKK